LISGSSAAGAATPPPGEVCRAYEQVLAEARHRLWLAVPWVYSHSQDPWLVEFIARFAEAARRCQDVRAYLRPAQVNAQAAASWRAAGVSVIQGTPGVRYLHAKLLVGDNVALLTSANLIDADLHRNVNQASLERRPEEVARWADFVARLDEAEAPETEADATWEPAIRLLPSDLRRYFEIQQLNPMQAEAVPKVLHSTSNLVVAAATGAGKTLVAEVALLDEVVHRGRTGVYLVPMRALAAEKAQEWRRLEQAGLRVYKTSGEDDAFDPSQALRADLIIATPEKWDAVSRRRLSEELVGRIGTIVADEVHLVDEPGRGPGLEALLSRIRLAFPAARLVAMSGTLPNAEAIARWLDAELVASSWRPVRLTKVVVPYPEAARRAEDEALRNGLVASIAHESLADDGTVLVFCGSRPGVESCAAVLAESLGLDEPLLRASPSHRALRETLRRGVAFHHAGLPKEDRALVERAFRGGEIRVLVATSTVAMGVNLPAREVIVRDLVLGTSDLSAASLLQMAGRAGRPGLQAEGRCFVLAPEREIARVQRMLEGGTLQSRLADDVATHINTEIALRIITSRQQLTEWYARTLHRQVASQPVDLGAAFQWLLDNGFVQELDDAVGPTALGTATNQLMLRVASAAQLEQFLIERVRRTTDPEVLEEELLFAACGRPVEFDDLRSRKAEEEVLQRVAARDPRVSGWALGRVRYLLGAAAVLTGADAAALPLEDSPALLAAVQRDVPRFLRFLARRADERASGSPDIVVAATDLATALEAGIAERGCGRLLEAIKFGYRADESRRRKTLAEYGRLRASGIETLTDALDILGERARQVVQALPRVEISLAVRDGQIVGALGRARRPVRAHVRLGNSLQENVVRLESADPRDVALVHAGALGGPGLQELDVEVVFTGAGQQSWVYGRRRITLDVAADAATNNYAAVEAILAEAAGQTSYVTERRRGLLARAIAYVSGSRDLDGLQEQLEQPPEAVRRAAAILSSGVTTSGERVERIADLMRRRTLRPATATPRMLGLVASADPLTRAEGALLGAALLRAMGTDARVLWATIDDEASALCTWREGAGAWHPVPIWPARHVRVHGERVADAPAGPETAPLIGWDVIGGYTRIGSRRLPLLEAMLGEGAVPAADIAVPSCPACQAAMRVRRGQNGAFWGCSRYPTCRSTLPMMTPTT
jgi:helicase